MKVEQVGVPPEGWVEGELMPDKKTWHEADQGPFPDDLNRDEYNIIPAEQ